MDLVSVIIPAYKAEHMIAAALDAVLAQTYAPVEIIVVDDGSPDGTREAVVPYVERYPDRVRYISKPNGGVSTARNLGFAQSHGDYVLFLDHDDLIAPMHLEKLHEALATHAEWGVAYSAARYIDHTGTKDLGDIYLPKSGDLLVEIVLRRTAFPSTGIGLIRRTVFEAVGGYDEQIVSMDDMDLWIRIALAGHHYGFIDDRSFSYRIHAQGKSNQVPRHEAMYMAILNKLYGGPNVRPELAAVRKEAYAIAYYEIAARYFRADQPAQGKDRLAKAVAECDWMAKDKEWLLQWVSFNTMTPRNADPQRYLCTVFENLPPEAKTLARLKTRAVGDFHIATVFEAYRRGDLASILPHLLPGICGDPYILKNKGFIALCIGCLLWLLQQG